MCRLVFHRASWLVVDEEDKGQVARLVEDRKKEIQAEDLDLVLAAFVAVVVDVVVAVVHHMRHRLVVEGERKDSHHKGYAGELMLR